MRLIITNLFIAILLTTSLVAQESMEYFQAEFSSNPKDDKNIVVTGRIGYGGDFKAILFDIENDNHEVFDIDIPKGIYIRSIEINAESNRIAYYTSDSIVIFNYLTFEKEQTFELDTNIKKSSFSKDGNKYFFYNSTENQVLVYNIDDAQLVAIHDLEPINDGYRFTSYNQFTDEVAFRKDSTLIIWSLNSHNVTNTIPFKEEYGFHSFEENGNMFSFYYDIEKEGQSYRENVIGVANTADGSIKYKTEIGYSKPNNIEFTSDMRYLLEYYELRFQEIYDLEEDTRVDNMLSVGQYGRINYLYISPDLEYSIILEAGTQSCGINWGDSQRYRERISTFNFKEKSQIKHLINKFIEMPIRAVISEDNNYAVINSTRGRHENILVTIDEKLVKYLKVTDAAPVLFIDKSKFIGFRYYERIKFYNVETDEFDKEFDTGLNSISKYYYTKNGDGRIIVMNNDTINIFNYSDLSLNKTIVVSESGIGSNIRFDGKENLIGYDGDKINKYNIFDESITSDVIDNIPDGFIFKRFSPNGRYVLFGKYDGYKNINYEVGIYDMQTDIFRTKDLASDSLNENSPEFTFGLVGNLPIVWYFYHYAKFKGGHSLYYTYSSYDFDKESISEYDFNDPEYFENGDRSYLSNDYNYYIKLNCPWSYSITQLVDPQSSVETVTTITGSVYPNPASDFIKLDLNASSMNSSIQIFDAYGKQVMSVIYSGEDIDISKLTAGVYFVKTGNGTHKFVKM
ncbi:MAG: hypothetical protein CVV25_07235 [Ignavibacteriae bacterium HGW-Ignavibacteriae-4]|jgi:hypothetical protein|nr:MAG: hypothetical protein CVV25_07235 [Ignavibacteriae bacterium HGW-Ignavibacteriae-4]